MTEGGGSDAVPKTRQHLVCVWRCSSCSNDCNVMRSENRCICGHRLREHKPPSQTSSAPSMPCQAPRCACHNFFYMIAEGAWIIRCRCHHKHIEHDATPPYKCVKCKNCSGFDSPFVCNCSHRWASHKQVWEKRDVLKLLQEGEDVGNPNIVKRGLDECGE